MGHNYKTPIDDLWAVVQERNVRMEKLVRKAVEDMKSMDGESKTMFKNTSPIVCRPIYVEFLHKHMNIRIYTLLWSRCECGF